MDKQQSISNVFSAQSKGPDFFIQTQTLPTGNAHRFMCKPYKGAGHCWLWNCVLEELAPFKVLRNITWPEMLRDGNLSSPSPPANTVASSSAFLQEKELHRSFLGSGTHLPFSFLFFFFPLFFPLFFGVFCFVFTWSVPIVVIKDKARHQQLLLYNLNDIFMLHHMG